MLKISALVHSYSHVPGAIGCVKQGWLLCKAIGVPTDGEVRTTGACRDYREGTVGTYPGRQQYSNLGCRTELLTTGP